MQDILLPHSCIASHSTFPHHRGLWDDRCSNSRIPIGLLQLSSCWHVCFKPGSPTDSSKYTCPSRYWKIFFLPHHARSFWFSLASCLPQNKFQDCYYHCQGSRVPAAILSRCHYSTVCANMIIAIFFFIVTMCSQLENRNGKVQFIFICCLNYLE